MSAEETIVVEADLSRADHQRAIVEMTAAYARDPMGNGKPLPADVLQRLVPGLRAHPTTIVLLAYAGGQVVGIATCFLGFSTFAARPIVNVHDLYVLGPLRGRGIGRALLIGVETVAHGRGCAKVTLEVLEHNRVARQLYESIGYFQATYSPENGGALFYAKTLGYAPESPAEAPAD